MATSRQAMQSGRDLSYDFPLVLQLARKARLHGSLD
jgi:hypothetical protein